MFGGGDRFGPLQRPVRELWLAAGGADSVEGVNALLQLDPVHLHCVALALDLTGTVKQPVRRTRIERVNLAAVGGQYSIITVTPAGKELEVEWLEASGSSGGTIMAAYVERLVASSVDPLVVSRTVVAADDRRTVFGTPDFEVATGYQTSGAPVYPFNGSIGSVTQITTGTSADAGHSIMAGGGLLKRIPVGHRLVIAGTGLSATIQVSFRIAEVAGIGA